MSDEGHKAMGRGVGRRPFVSSIEAPGTSTGSQQAGQGGEAEWQWQGETGHAAETRASGSGSDTVYRRGPSLLSVAISPRKSQTGNPPPFYETNYLPTILSSKHLSSNSTSRDGTSGGLRSFACSHPEPAEMWAE